MKYLKYYIKFDNIKESNNYKEIEFPKQYFIEDFFYEYTDNKTKEENIIFLYSAWLVFLTTLDVYDFPSSVNSEHLSDLFCDLNDVKFDSYQNRFFNKSESILVTSQELSDGKPTDTYHDVKLSGLQEEIMKKIKLGTIPAYPYFKLNLGMFKIENFNNLLECLSRFYDTTGWRPVDEIWSEDYINDDGYVSTCYGATLNFFKVNDKVYTKLTKIFNQDKSSDSLQLKMNSIFI
jgi:hypothetical protein